jgi:hypothetical protein
LLDGGGVRGYSSLLILQKLMEIIKDIEVDHSDGSATSSYHPEPYREPFSSHNSRNGRIGETDSHKAGEDTRLEYLPCHSFDFIGGTSTGG